MKKPTGELAPDELEVIKAVKALSRQGGVRYAGGKVKAHVAGVITDRGAYVPAALMRDEYGANFAETDGSIQVKYSDTYKSAGVVAGIPAELAARGTRELSEDQNPFDFNADNIIESPWPYELLSQLLTGITMHAACVETKASDYTYCGYQLEATEWAQQNVSPEVLNAARDEVEAFLSNIADGRGIEDLYRDVATDYESLGCGGFEIRRDAMGFISKCNHVPFGTMRVTKKAFFEATGARFLQRRWQKKVYFTHLNHGLIFKAVTGEILDPLDDTADKFPPFETREAYIESEGIFVDYLSGDETIDPDYAANEFYMIARPPFTKSAVYGTPAGYTAYKAMLAQVKIDDYNLQFFASKGVPQYAVVFKGLGDSDNTGTTQLGETVGTGDDASYAMTPSETAQMEQVVHEFFMKKLAQSDRSVLLLTLYGEAEVSFEKLSSDKLDADFAEYEQRNQNKIRIAHRVPNAALGIDPEAGTGGIGTGSRDLSQMRRYRDHTVAPNQHLFERITNNLIRCGLLIPYFDFKFLPMSIEEEQAAQDSALKEWDSGAITLDEYREATGRAPLPDGRGNVYKVKTTEQFIGADSSDVSRGMLEAKAAELNKLKRKLAGQDTFDELDNLEALVDEA